MATAASGSLSVSLAPVKSFEDKLAELKQRVISYTERAETDQRFQTGQAVLSAIGNTGVATKVAREAIEAKYDALKLIVDTLSSNERLGELSTRAAHYNKELASLDQGNVVRLTGFPDPLKWSINVDKVRVVFQGRNMIPYNMKSHSLTIDKTTLEPYTCTDKTWEFDVPVKHLTPNLLQPVFVRGIFKSHSKATGYFGADAPAELDVILKLAPSSPGEFKITYKQEAKECKSREFELNSKGPTKTKHDFEIEIPQGWELDSTEPELEGVTEVGECSHKIIKTVNKITVRASCGEDAKLGYQKFMVKYKIQRTNEDVHLRYGETRKLPADLQKVEFKGHDGEALSGLEFKGREVYLTKHTNGTYILAAHLADHKA